MKAQFALFRRSVWRIGSVACVLIASWQLTVWLFDLPHYILPAPVAVAEELSEQWALLFIHSQTTLFEILSGLVIGFLLGLFSALLLSFSDKLSAFLLPLLVLSQAIPVFAVAPLLVLWFGYGAASKIAMSVLIIYFPVTAACYDGLRNTPKQWLELARTLGVSDFAILFRVRLPAALPALASGLRIGVSVAPIGAIVGEWVGSSQGLGYLMLQANARMQTDLMFAALCILMAMTLALYFLVDKTLRRLIPWVSHLR
ncbi:ABC transporter permease [Caviibacterium pharyngocola]|uniref:ABC transporter permease n=1 Tax=Caviibacterium pharyngocola TaxID=28159 RepID=A0A2M8RSP5_9PAST|nr:ABC transporter permease [Caviibacterium pharyngocola]PJG81906.1 ABC transporter permease [Caviibacterium pharyngocola]